MEIKELFQSLFDSSTERIKNPFIGSYITAFTLYNWRAIFLLIFSNASIEDKIVVINHEYCSKESILWPMAIAIFYILILPYLNLLFDALLSYSNSKKDTRLKAVIKSNLEQKKAVAKYEREIADERAGTNEVGNLKDKIDALEKESELKSKEIVDVIAKNNEDIQNWKMRYDHSATDNQNLEEKISNLVTSNSVMSDVFPLLIDPRQTANRDIKNYLRNNLSNDDFLKLKNHTEDTNTHYAALPLTWENNALLLKAKVYKLAENNKHFEMTNEGRKFISDLE